jgi:epoxyqueuosine reductase
VDLFRWDRATFEEKTAGSPIRRAGYEGFLRNLAVALGNAPWSEEIEAALEERADDPSELVREHVHWALAEQRGKRDRLDTRLRPVENAEATPNSGVPEGQSNP